MMIEQIPTTGVTTEAQELVARAKALRPLLQKNAARTEDERRVPEESIQAIADAGVFRSTVPRRYGGYEVSFRTKLEVSAAIAEGDGAAGWVVTLINVCNWFASLYPQRAQDEVFGADPNARIAGVLAPSSKARRVDGGLIVTGKWYYSSGSLHATWGLVGVPVVNEAGEQVDQGLALVPMEQLTIEDTWYVIGMKGTGSNALVANEVFIPDYRIISLPAAIEGHYPTEHKEEALYRSAFVPVAVLVLVGPQLGMGRAALDYVISKASQRAIAYTSFQKQTDSVAFQLQIAEAAVKIDTAHLLAYQAADDIDEAAARNEYPDYTRRARIRAYSGAAITHITEAINILLSAHGAGSFALSSPLQRIWRDSNTSARHAVTLPIVSDEVYGKALLGVENTVTPLV
ncbi:MAG TPA: acyl-CoA dehydrogenase family protein [Ktedonobacteraceae bacterium]|nr:acyl-CoA dehydrogenase family protein [Ktedonobacteraceae bacterium]